jgi:hypothetical protein
VYRTYGCTVRDHDQQIDLAIPHHPVTRPCRDVAVARRIERITAQDANPHHQPLSVIDK